MLLNMFKNLYRLLLIFWPYWPRVSLDFEHIFPTFQPFSCYFNCPETSVYLSGNCLGLSFFFIVNPFLADFNLLLYVLPPWFLDLFAFQPSFCYFDSPKRYEYLSRNNLGLNILFHFTLFFISIRWIGFTLKYAYDISCFSFKVCLWYA